MKLPENKKERVQMLVLIGMGAALVVFLVIQFVAGPIRASRRELQDRLAKKESQIEKAKKEMLRGAMLTTEYDTLTADIDKLISDNLRRPILGSYLVGATEILDATARQTGLLISDSQEIGVQELPQNKKTAATVPRSFKSYAVQVNGEASYGQTLAFIRKLEEDNPLLCITAVSIEARPENRQAHRVSVRVEWPIEASPEEQKGGKP